MSRVWKRSELLKGILGTGVGAIATVLLKRYATALGRVVGFSTVRVNHQGEIVARELKEAKYTSLDLGEGITIDLVYVPSGSFRLGSPPDEKLRDEDEEPRKRVRMSSFWLSRSPITQAQYRRVMGVNPAYFRGDNLPVERVNWHQAQEFCAQVSSRLGKSIRLPSEAQWEYACRAQSETTFTFGPTLNSQIANYRATSTYAEESPGIFRQTTTPVGMFPANAWGLYDLHGNVWEWCEDTYQESYQGAPGDGSPWIVPGNEKLRVLKGGSWYVDPRNCRTAVRAWDISIVTIEDVGFRVVANL